MTLAVRADRLHVVFADFRHATVQGSHLRHNGPGKEASQAIHTSTGFRASRAFLRHPTQGRRHAELVPDVTTEALVFKELVRLIQNDEPWNIKI